MIADRRSNAPSTGDVGRQFAKAPGELVARQHHVRDGAHHPVEQLDRKSDRARCGGRPALAFGDRRSQRGSRALGARRQRVDQRAVVTGRHFFAGFDRGDHLADAIDDREHCADQLRHRARGGRRGRRQARPRQRGSALRGAGIRRSRNCPSPCGRSGRCYRGARGRPAAASQATISPPRASSISRHSATKSAIRSSIGSAAPSAASRAAYAGQELTRRYPCRAFEAPNREGQVIADPMLAALAFLGIGRCAGIDEGRVEARLAERAALGSSFRNSQSLKASSFVARHSG